MKKGCGNTGQSHLAAFEKSILCKKWMLLRFLSFFSFFFLLYSIHSILCNKRSFSSKSTYTTHIIHCFLGTSFVFLFTLDIHPPLSIHSVILHTYNTPQSSSPPLIPCLLNGPTATTSTIISWEPNKAHYLQTNNSNKNGWKDQLEALLDLINLQPRLETWQQKDRTNNPPSHQNQSLSWNNDLR